MTVKEKNIFKLFWPDAFFSYLYKSLFLYIQIYIHICDENDSK